MMAPYEDNKCRINGDVYPNEGRVIIDDAKERRVERPSTKKQMVGRKAVAKVCETKKEKEKQESKDDTKAE